MDRELRQRRVGVLMGGVSAERAVSLETGAAVIKALEERGFSSVIAIDVDASVAEKLVQQRIEVAFIALHGRFGEDGCIQGLLELLQIPYTGSGVMASAIAMDKVMTKHLAQVASIPTPRWAYPAAADSIIGTLTLPVVLKPRGEGSSVGVKVVRTAEQLTEALALADGPLLAEQYIEGRELSVAVFGTGDAARCLGTVEIRVVEDFYDYAAKYERDDTQYIVEPELPSDVREQLLTTSLSIHRLLRCSGVSRVDFRWDGKSTPVLLELNTLPGMTAGHSLVPMIAAEAGIGFGELIEKILEDSALMA